MRLVLVLIAFASFSGCAITTKIPVNRFDSPETMGRGSGELLGGDEGDSEFTITPDDTATPPNFSNPTFSNSNDFLLQGGLSLAGLIPRTDIYAKLRTAGVLEGVIKFQILGEPRNVAKEGNFSLAVTAGAGGSSSSDSDNTTYFTSSTSAQYSTTVSAVDFGAIMGYRLSEWALVYAGWAWTRQTYSGTLTQTTSSGGSSPQYLYSGQLRQTTADLGIEFNPGAFLGRVEYAFAWSSAAATSLGYHNGYFGLELGVSFGGHAPEAREASAEPNKTLLQ
jgi:hypothetical protein